MCNRKESWLERGFLTQARRNGTKYCENIDSQSKSFSSGLRGYCGTITVSAEEVDEGSKECAEFHVRATKLARKDVFGSSDPFLKFYRLTQNGRQLAHQTKHLKNTLNPEWAVFRVNMQMLCGGDRRRPFLIECWDHEFDGSHQFIGSATVSIEEILTKTKTSIQLVNENVSCAMLCCLPPRTNSGVLHFVHLQVIKQHTFLDFIQAGTQLDFTVAVDLTASNGDPRLPTSLHYVGGNTPSQYEIAIRAVIEICQYYNKTKLFNAFGFGAITPGLQRKMSPIFNLTLTPSCEVFGLQGILEAYHQSISMVKLYGPTNFAPVVMESARRASETLDGSRYQILLIITDGAISDMADTKRAIISASFLPLSIIIVGVGDDDFGNMDELDSDDCLLSFEGRQAQRDIVQFVPMRQFLRGPVTGLEGERVMWLLAKEVLAEVPLQLTSYMEMNRISPKQSDDSNSELEVVFAPTAQDGQRLYPSAPLES